MMSTSLIYKAIYTDLNEQESMSIAHFLPPGRFLPGSPYKLAGIDLTMLSDELYLSTAGHPWQWRPYVCECDTSMGASETIC